MATVALRDTPPLRPPAPSYSDHQEHLWVLTWILPASWGSKPREAPQAPGPPFTAVCDTPRKEQPDRGVCPPGDLLLCWHLPRLPDASAMQCFAPLLLRFPRRPTSAAGSGQQGWPTPWHLWARVRRAVHCLRHTYPLPPGFTLPCEVTEAPILFCFNILKFIYFERERSVRMCVQVGEEQSGKERPPSRLRTVSTELDMGLEPTNREIMTRAKITSGTLKRQSRPGALPILFSKRKPPGSCAGWVRETHCGRRTGPDTE